MRISALVTAVGGVLVAAALTAEPAMARHLWSAEYGWRTGHHHRPVDRIVRVRPNGDTVIVRRTPNSRRVTVIHPDGSRTVRVQRRAAPPVVVYR